MSTIRPDILSFIVSGVSHSIVLTFHDLRNVSGGSHIVLTFHDLHKVFPLLCKLSSMIDPQIDISIGCRSL